MLNNFIDKNSFKTIINLAWPLILATCSNVIQQYVDKIFLAQYSQDALAAVVPAGMVTCVVTCFFTGIIGYVSNFIAQYRGAKEYENVPIIMNQTFFLSLIFSVICFFFCFAGKFLFIDLAKHDLALAELEIQYFKPLLYMAFVPIFLTGVSCFFIGIEKSNIILYANIITTVINIIFDYIFIFGKFGITEMGITGAAYATALGQFVGCVFLFIFYFSDKYNREYKTRCRFFIDIKNIRKMVHYGVPSGIQMTLDFLIWTIFILILGKFSVLELAASNIAFQVDQIAFMPVLGVGAAVSILVANGLGKKDKMSLSMIIRTSMFMAAIYNLIIAVLFLFVPLVLILPFTDITNPDKELIDICIILLRLLAVYVIADGFNIIFLSVLRGAGDTVFIMYVMFVCGILLIIIPAYISIKINNLYFAWYGVISYIFALCIIFLIRVKQGKWKKIKIIA